MARKKIKSVKAWAGVSDGEMLVSKFTDPYGEVKMPEVFKRRVDARRRFQHVVRVEIRVIADNGSNG